MDNQLMMLFFIVVLNLIIHAVLSAGTSSFKTSHRASCNRKQLCNGNLMCAFVCEKGTVEVDQWVRFVSYWIDFNKNKDLFNNFLCRL